MLTNEQLKELEPKAIEAKQYLDEAGKELLNARISINSTLHYDHLHKYSQANHHAKVIINDLHCKLYGCEIPDDLHVEDIFPIYIFKVITGNMP